MRKGFGVIASAVLGLVAVAPARAADMNALLPDLNLPGFTVTPFLTERGEYRSNVFQVPSGSKDDFIWKTIPGVVVELPFGPHRFDMGARAEILNYTDLTRQDVVNSYYLGLLALNFPGGLTLRLRDDLARTTDPPGTELTGPIRSLTNSLAPDVEYSLSDRFSVGGNYAWTHVSFDTIPQLDRDEHLIGATGFWKFQPKSALLLNYSYGLKDFSDSTRDVTRNLVLVGVRGDITSRLSSTLRVGVEDREPDRRGLTSFLGPVASGDVTFRPTDRTSFGLAVDRSPAESIFATNLFYVGTIASLSANQHFTPKLNGTLRVFGGSNLYPDKATVNGRTKWRHDDLVGWGVGVDYAVLRWLGVGADYTRQERDSNFRIFNFTNDIVAAHATASF